MHGLKWRVDTVTYSSKLAQTQNCSSDGEESYSDAGSVTIPFTEQSHK